MEKFERSLRIVLFLHKPHWVKPEIYKTPFGGIFFGLYTIGITVHIGIGYY